MQQIYRTQYGNFIRAEHVWKLQINTFMNARGKPVSLFNVHVHTNAAFERVLTNYVALRWVQVRQPWLGHVTYVVIFLGYQRELDWHRPFLAASPTDQYWGVENF